MYKYIPDNLTWCFLYFMNEKVYKNAKVDLNANKVYVYKQTTKQALTLK